ncbi:MAG: prolipoprotein diacylglyceryl transferase [Hyphomicrobiaceae bacterium]
MSELAAAFPAIDPVAFWIGPIPVKWYGLAYLAGLLLGWMYIKRLLAAPRLWPGGLPPFPPARTDDLLMVMTFGVVIGGRLGFVLLYEPHDYLSHPLQILLIWRGGMAFHGALLGCGLAAWLFAKVAATSVRSTLDLCAAAVPIGLFFGRLANFVNAELWGRTTQVPWAMVFPGAGHELRHPSQLYEAVLEGLVLFVVLRVTTHRYNALQTPGRTTGLFLIGYGLARTFCETFREPYPGHIFNVGPLTAGMAYSIPMIVLGLSFLRMAGPRTAP